MYCEIAPRAQIARGVRLLVRLQSPPVLLVAPSQWSSSHPPTPAHFRWWCICVRKIQLRFSFKTDPAHKQALFVRKWDCINSMRWRRGRDSYSFKHLQKQVCHLPRLRGFFQGLHLPLRPLGLHSLYLHHHIHNPELLPRFLRTYSPQHSQFLTFFCVSLASFGYIQVRENFHAVKRALWD